MVPESLETDGEARYAFAVHLREARAVLRDIDDWLAELENKSAETRTRHALSRLIITAMVLRNVAEWRKRGGYYL